MAQSGFVPGVCPGLPTPTKEQMVRIYRMQIRSATRRTKAAKEELKECAKNREHLEYPAFYPEPARDAERALRKYQKACLLEASLWELLEGLQPHVHGDAFLARRRSDIAQDSYATDYSPK